jgi:hypothetical protein
MPLTNIRLKVIYGTHLLVHTTMPPSEEEWTTNLHTISQHHDVIKGILVYTMGGGPNAVQRSLYNQTIEKLGLKPKVAIMSGSAIVRGIMTAFNWAQGGLMKMFPLDGVQHACDYLGVSMLEQGVIGIQLQKFKEELRI